MTPSLDSIAQTFVSEGSGIGEEFAFEMTPSLSEAGNLPEQQSVFEVELCIQELWTD